MNLLDSKFTNIMLDIETGDTEPTAHILQIGCAVMGAGELSFPFEATIGFVYPQPGRTISMSTMDWWADPSRAEARKQVWKREGLHLLQALIGLRDHFNTIETSLGKPLRVWTKSSKFDYGILDHACKQLDIELPVSFREWKCYRSIADVFPSIKAADAINYYMPKEFDPLYHTAYADVIHQGFHMMYIVEQSQNHGVIQF